MAIIGALLINCKLCDVKLKLQKRIAGNLSQTVLNIIYSEVLHTYGGPQGTAAEKMYIGESKYA